MKTSKTRTEYVVQARLNGATPYDVKSFTTARKANSWLDWVTATAFPTWRGLTLSWRIIRRTVTTETETEILCHDTLARGKKRILIGELMVPSWLPKRLWNHYKSLPIPGYKKP